MDSDSPMYSNLLSLSSLLIAGVIFTYAHSEAVTISLQTGNPIHVLKVGEEDQLGLRLVSDAKDVGSIVEYSIVKLEPGAIASARERVVIKESGEVLVPLTPPAEKGVYRIHVDVLERAGASKPASTRTLSYAYMTPAGPTQGWTEGFIFGVCAHPQLQDHRAQELEAMAAAWSGVMAVREDVLWRLMQPEKDRWDFAPFDRVLGIYSAYNIDLLPILAYTPTWAVAEDWVPIRSDARYGSRPDYSYWKTFVQTFAERYRDKLRFVEVWNEPDHYSFANFPAADYVKMMEIAYDEVKRIAPQWQVFNGGITCLPFEGSRWINHDTLDAILASGKYDLFAFHAHGLFPGYKGQIDQFPTLKNTKPWYANETAVSSMLHGEDVQAQTLFQKLIYSWAHGAVGYNWYNLRNNGTEPKNNEHNFGLITRDFYPKPVYAAYNSLALFYTGAKFVRELPITARATFFSYLFIDKSGDYLIPNWTDSLTEQPVIVSNIKGHATLIDLWGQETELPVENEIVILPISSRPSTLRITGQDVEPVISGLLFSLDGDVSAVANGTQQFRFEFSNPTQTPIPLSIAVTSPDFIQVDPQRVNVVLQPKRRESFGFELHSGSGSTHGMSDNLVVDIAFGKLWKKQLSYKIRQSISLPVDGFTELPVFVLDDASQVTSVVINDPTTAHMFWKGKDDLSAEIWLGKTESALIAKIVVVDDVHVQNATGNNLWQGDSVHFMLDLGQSSIWDIGLSHHPENGTEVFVLTGPESFERSEVNSNLKLRTSRDEATKITLYELEIPFSAIGMNLAMLTHGIGFNVMVNDNDGDRRESFISIVPGEERFRKAEFFPNVIFAEE